MIISHRHKFIFIKTQKTAGTSLEIALSKFCGEDDIITPITNEDECLRKKLGFRTAQNYFFPVRPWSIRYRVKNGEWPKKYFNHIPAHKIKSRVGEEVWDSYFKFSIVRDPLERAISYYFWAVNHNKDVKCFDDFLRKYSSKLSENIDILCYDGSMLVNDIVYLESANKDLKRIGQKIGLPEDLDAEFQKINAKGHYRPKGEKPKITKEQRDVLIYFMRFEASMFGYQIQDPEKVIRTID
jgi:hypothetical protein